MWRYDAGHTAAAPDDLPPRLELEWVRVFTPREPVWDDPLNRDLMPYDRIFEPIILGRLVLVGFNDCDKVVALDLDSGATRWTFYTDGPVRLPPVGWQDRVFFASDDGHLYCVRADDGTEVWRFRGGPSQRKVLGNKRVISMWPARGGPVLRDGAVYFAASIWPFMGTFLYALDAATGQVQWVNDSTGAQYLKQPHSAPSFGGIAPQGTMVATRDMLLVPGGRSIPAALDRATGQLRHFLLNEGGKGNGGSLVIADDQDFYLHTRYRGVRRFDLQTGVKTEVMCNEPVLGGDVIYTATDTEVMAVDRAKNVRWKLTADGRGDLIQAGTRLYAAGPSAVSAITLPRGGSTAEVAWSIPVEGNVLRLLAGGGKLLAVTQDGRLMAFGAKATQREPIRDEIQPLAVAPQRTSEVRSLIERTGAREGYALCFGVGDGALLAALLEQSQLNIVVVEPDAAKVHPWRPKLDAAGCYGRRVALHVGDPVSFQAPPLLAKLMVVDPGLAHEYSAARFLAALYASLRPYGGTLWFPGPRPAAPAALAGQAATVDPQSAPGTDLQARLQAAVSQEGLLPKAKLVTGADDLQLVREGPLPGAARWTHQYGNVANTVKSDDQLVKAPLGILWFGGNSNLDILPRHGHGPPPQVLGGRLFIQGINSVSARDVYTGQVLWKREFKDLGTHDVFYDATYKETPLDPAYNQLHIPGANARGTNYVATDEGLYLVIDRMCGLLDSATGKTIRVLKLPTEGTGPAAPRWSFLGVAQDVVLGGTGFADYTKRLKGVEYKADSRRGIAWSPDWFGSRGLVAFDRPTGTVLWQKQARHSFLQNGIVAGGGRVYCLDKLPKSVEEQLARRGQAQPDTYRILALDAKTGATVWETSHEVFGTWLGYSAEHDILLQAGAAAKDRSPEEVGQGLISYRGRDGAPIWRRTDLAYAGPCILHGTTIIPNAVSNEVSSAAVNLLDGSDIMITNPLTGQPEPWRYVRNHGCTTAVASEHLLTYRSGAAGYYDLNTKCGTGNLGGFRSGCSYNLIAADGVLNAPDYTRTCSCGYQNQTSLALVHMPEVETWTISLFKDLRGVDWIERVGLNLGAPGDRCADDGTLWLTCPVAPSDGASLSVQLAGDGLEFFCRHASAARESPLPWVAASGARNLRRLAIR
ncbi:MAG: hypothetical protein A2W31_09210, partial [Planctomycetes bacterium RBG_16_64_10]